VIEKEAEKILKYKDLTIEIQRMWNVKARVIPVIIGWTGTISKSFRKYVSDIPRKHDVKELQKTAILGTAHILRKVLTHKNERANAGTRHRGTINNKDRIAATTSPRDMVCLGNLCMDTLQIFLRNVGNNPPKDATSPSTSPSSRIYVQPIYRRPQ